MVQSSTNISMFKPGDVVVHSGECQLHCKNKQYTLKKRIGPFNSIKHGGEALEYYWVTEEPSNGVWENFLTHVNLPKKEWSHTNIVGQNHWNDLYQLMFKASEDIAFGKPLFYSTSDGVELFNESHVNIIKSNKNYKNMSIIDKIRVNIKGEPMKTLIKNDILTIDERLTNVGKELFMDFLYAKHKDEFVADIAPKLEGINDK